MNDVQAGILGRVEAALKSGALWIEDHFHALLDNIETALGGGTPTVDPLPADTIANTEVAAAQAQAEQNEQAAPAAEVEQAAPAAEVDEHAQQ